MRGLIKEQFAKIPKKTGKKLLYIGGIVMILLCYLLIFQRLNGVWQEKREHIEQGKIERAQLIEMKNHQKENKAETKALEKDIAKCLKQFPVDVMEEDAILHAASLEKNFDVKVSDLGFTQKNLIQAGEKTGYTLFARPVEYTFSAGYTDMKLMIAELAEKGDMRNVESITLGFDAKTGGLRGVMTTNYYSISGNELAYEAPKNKGVDTGNRNVFGTNN